MLNYDEFIRELLTELPLHIPDIAFDIQKIYKVNQPAYDGLVLFTVTGNMAPILPMEELFRQYCKEGSVTRVCNSVSDFCKNAPCRNILDFMTTAKDFSAFRDRLCCALVGCAQNEEFLKIVPHTKFLDLAYIYYIQMISDNGEDHLASVNNQLFELWGIDIETLHEAACINTLRLYPLRLEPIGATIARMLEAEGIPAELFPMKRGNLPPTYILTLPDYRYGAAGILASHLLRELAGQLENDLYLIPSSICEVLLVPAIEEARPQELKELLAEMNEQEGADAEKLSEHIYLYRRDIGSLEIYI